MKSLFLLALALPLGACVPSAPSYLLSPADPSVGTQPARYTAVTRDVRAYNVVEPLDWREQNRRVAPDASPALNDSNDAARRGR